MGHAAGQHPLATEALLRIRFERLVLASRVPRAALVVTSLTTFRSESRGSSTKVSALA